MFFQLLQRNKKKNTKNYGPRMTNEPGNLHKNNKIKKSM